MKERVDLTERELEEMGLVDLGDASEQTKQIWPLPEIPDSLFGWGLYH